MKSSRDDVQNRSKDMGSFLHHGLRSRKMLSFMCSIAEQNQDIIENLENLTVADLSAEAQTALSVSLNTQISNFVEHVKNSVLSLCEELRSEISLKEETGIEPSKEALFGALVSMESIMKSSPEFSVKKEVVELECNNILDLCLKFSLKLEEIEEKYLIEVCGSVQQILEVLCSGVHPDLILETVVELKTALSVCVKAFYARFKDLLSPDSYCLMIASMSSLKRTLFILLDSINSIHKAASANHDFIGKDYILKQLKLSLDMLIAAAISPTPSSQQDDEIGEPGEFVSCVDKILTLVSSIKSESSFPELQKLVEKAVVHSLSVAQLSAPASQERIKKASEAVIAQSRFLTQLYESKKKTEETTLDFRVSVQSCCENLISEVENLEQQVNLSVLELIVDVLTVPMQPVYDLMDAAVQNQGSTKEPVNEDKISYIKMMGDKFHQHTDKMYHVCRFAAACCTDKEMIYTLLVTVKNMELLDVEIVPTVVMNSCADLLKKFPHLQLLLSEWHYHVNSLQQILFKITDAPAILKVIDDSIKKEVKAVCHFLYDQEGTEMKKATVNLLKLANCATQVASAFIQEVQDIPDLSILKKSSKNLRKSIRSVKKSDDVFSNLTDLEAHRSLQKHCIILSSCVHDLQKVHEDFYNKHGCAYLGMRHEPLELQVDKTQGIALGLHELSLRRYSFTCGNTSVELETSSVPVVQENIGHKQHETSVCDLTSASNINLEITAILDSLKSDNSMYSDSINFSQTKPCRPPRKVGKTNPKFLKNSMLEVSSNTVTLPESAFSVPA